MYPRGHITTVALATLISLSIAPQASAGYTTYSVWSRACPNAWFREYTADKMQDAQYWMGVWKKKYPNKHWAVTTDSNGNRVAPPNNPCSGGGGGTPPSPPGGGGWTITKNLFGVYYWKNGDWRLDDIYCCQWIAADRENALKKAGFSSYFLIKQYSWQSNATNGLKCVNGVVRDAKAISYGWSCTDGSN